MIAVLVVVLASFIINAATAGSGCAQQIIEDWSDNGTIDGAYPTDCYQQAIAALPEDLRSYSSAADDINRALQQALLDGVDGSEGGDVAGSSGDPGSNDTGQNGGTGAIEPSEGAGGATTGEEPAPTTDGTPTPGGEVATTPPQAAAALAGDEGAGLPVPVLVLIVVAGVAAVVVLAVLGRRLVRDRSDRGV